MGSVVLTGASAGIGAAAAIELTKLGHEVLASGRSATKLAAVHRRMQAVAAPDLKVPEPVTVDLADLGQIRSFAELVLERFPRLDVLVNNAGIQPSRRSLSPNGVELTLAVNHLAPFALTGLLLDRLRSSEGRVVTTSSSNHAKAEFDFDDVQLERGWSTAKAYDRSKLANIWFTTELARRSGIPATSFHPGTITTDLNRDSPWVRWVKPFERFVMGPPEKGADTLVWLATSPEGGAPSAAYYYLRRPEPVSPAGQDLQSAARLWELSVDWARDSQ